MVNNEETDTQYFADLIVLRLAAISIDVRGRLAPHEIEKIPSLRTALDALDGVLTEMGWGEPIHEHRTEDRTPEILASFARPDKTGTAENQQPSEDDPHRERLIKE